MLIFGKFAKSIKIDGQLSRMYNININNMKAKELHEISRNVRFMYGQPIVNVKY